MFHFLLLAYMFLPMVGIYFLEAGSFTYTFHVNGYENGAFGAYFIHFMSFYFGFLLVFIWRRTPAKSLSYFQADYRVLCSRMLVFSTISFLLVWFVFGGYKVAFGVVGKGEFRTNLGPFGGVLYLVVKALLPAGFCYLTLLRMQEENRGFVYYLIAFIIAVTVLGLGFKALAVTVFLPSIICALYRPNFLSLLKVSGVVLALVVVAAILFDSKNSYNVSVFEFILARVTVLTGDVSWYLWSMSDYNLARFDLSSTMLGAFGRTPLSFFGVSTQDYLLNYSYGPALTTFVGRSESTVLSGFTVTGTLFSAALLSFGKTFFFLYSFVSGVFIGMLHFYFSYALKSGRYKMCAVLSSYLVFFVVGWVNSGDIGKLFHISTIVYLAIGYLFLSLMSVKVNLSLRLAV